MAAEVVINVKAEDNFSGVLGNFGNIVTGISSAVNLASQAFQAFTNVASQGLDAVASWERLGAVMETLSAKEILAAGGAENMAEALGAAGPKAEELLNWVQKLAIESPFTTEGVANAFRMAEAYGFTSDQAQRLTQAVIDFAAGSGATEDAMSRIVLALGQISATGHVTGQDMLQLVNAGLPVTQILADGFGVTTAKIMEMRSEGLLPAQQSIEMITQYLETNFAGAAERQANTWAGLQSTFEDIKTMGLREFFEGMFDALQPVAVSLSQFLQTTGMDKLREWGAALGEFTTYFAAFAEIAVAIVSGGNLTRLAWQLQSMGEKGSAVWDLGTAIRTLRDSLASGETVWQAAFDAFQKFAELRGFTFSADSFAGLAGEMVSNMVYALENKFIVWQQSGEAQQLADSIDHWLAGVITHVNWNATGSTLADSLGQALSSSFGSGGNNVQFNVFSSILLRDAASSETIAAAVTAIQQFFSGVWSQVVDWFNAEFNDAELRQARQEAARQWAVDLWDGFINWLTANGRLGQFGTYIYDGFRQAGVDAWNGLVQGLSSSFTDISTWVQTYIIDPVKRLLGIASPSTVFAEIGRSMIDGLVAGFLGAANSFLSIVTGFVNGIIDLFAPILSIFGIDLGHISLPNLGGGQVGGGTVGGTAGTGPPAGGGVAGLGGPVVYQYFAGATINVGSWDEITYDCIYPNPFVAATSNQLPSGGGGGGLMR